MTLKLRWLQMWGRCQIFPFGVRDRLIRLLHPVGRDHAFEIPFFGRIYQGNTRSYLDWTVFFYGAYELPFLMLTKQILGRTANPVVLDIGANVGHHTLFMSAYAAQIHAFEPFPAFCKSIAEKISLNI
ncbi:MAG: hypothetical protein OHK0019_31420 [Saprospiraceae bacterium]